jgi:hypothetical protein
MKKQSVLITLALGAMLALGGCAPAQSGSGQTAQSGQSSTQAPGGDVVTETTTDIAGSAANEAKEATKDNLRQGVREGVNSIFDGLFRR